MSGALRPILTLADVYGPGRVYLPRAHPRATAWIPPDACFLDAHTGCQSCVAGAMPVVCSAGTVTAAGQELLAEAGIAPPRDALPYRDPDHGLELARARVDRGHKLVLQHAHPAGVLPPEAHWIRPDLLAYLNNKANLAELVPAAHVPARSLRPRAGVFNGQAPPTPVVLKVPTDLSTGAGVAVALCRTSEDLAAAADRLGGCADLIVEEYLPIARNVCLHYAVMRDGAVRYLGYADQEVSDAGRYLGNWLRLGTRLPREVVNVGAEVARRGSALGYRGVVGMDIAMTGDAPFAVIDLNFRVNGSTPAVLLAPAILRAAGPALLHLRKFTSPAGFPAMIAAARAAVRRGVLIPLSTFDPAPAGHPARPPRLLALVRGTSEQDVLAVESALATDGLI